ARRHDDEQADGDLPDPEGEQGRREQPLARHPLSPRWAMLARSSASGDGAAPSHASRISSSTAGDAVRRLSASTFASFHLRAPAAVAASPQSAARMPGTLLAAIDAPV